MRGFEFATATRIIFGNGTIKEVAQLAVEMGKRAFLVTGRNRSRAAFLIRELEEKGIHVSLFSVTGEPTTDTVSLALAGARENGCDLVIAMGGGSVIDGAKAVAALMTNPGELMDYLEVIGKGAPLKQDPAPLIAIPTTSGTGAEVTKNAVIASTAHKVKVSLRHLRMVPDIAVVDPELTFSMPPHITAATGMDALTQVMEPYTSLSSNPLTDAICIEGMARAARSLPAAFRDGNNRSAREDMSVASLFGGLALANSKLGAVHGIAGPMGGMIHAPHGAVCARLLPNVMRINVAALNKRAPRSEALHRYDRIARILTGKENAVARDGAAFVETLINEMKIPPLSSYGLTPGQFHVLSEKSQKASSMKGNPITLTEDEIMEILESSF